MKSSSKRITLKTFNKLVPWLAKILKRTKWRYGKHTDKHIIPRFQREGIDELRQLEGHHFHELWGCAEVHEGCSTKQESSERNPIEGVPYFFSGHR